MRVHCVLSLRTERTLSICLEKIRTKQPTPTLHLWLWCTMAYAPTIPKELDKMTRNMSNAFKHLDDVENLIEGVLENLPPSICRDNIAKLLRHMRAANSQLTSTSFAIGTTNITNLPTEVPVLKLFASSMIAKTAHRHAAAHFDEPLPEKKSNETDQHFAQQKKDYKAAINKVALRDTKLGKNKCLCAESFPSEEAFLAHQSNVHPDPKSWKCSICPSVSNSKGHLWSHTRKTSENIIITVM